MLPYQGRGEGTRSGSISVFRCLQNANDDKLGEQAPQNGAPLLAPDMMLSKTTFGERLGEGTTKSFVSGRRHGAPPPASAVMAYLADECGPEA